MMALYKEFEEDFAEEDLAEVAAELADDAEEDFAEVEIEPENHPHQKSKKKSHDLRNQNQECVTYWKCALKLINAWAHRRNQKVNYHSTIELFDRICNLYHVSNIDETWLKENLKVYRDYEAYRRKIRRMLEKKQKIVSLRTLTIHSSH